MIELINGFLGPGRKLISVGFTCVVLISPARAAIFWNEASDGDLSNDQSAPKTFTLASGVNSVSGTVAGGSDTRDWLALTIPAGLQLSLVTPAAFVSSDAIGFTGVQRGAAFVGSPTDPGSYLGYSHFGAANVGVNILTAMSSASGAQGFTPPLGPGNYVFLIQQLGAATSYQFDYEVTPVPEPRAQVAAAILCGAFLLRQRWAKIRKRPFDIEELNRRASS